MSSKLLRSFVIFQVGGGSVARERADISIIIGIARKSTVQSAPFFVLRWYVFSVSVCFIFASLLSAVSVCPLLMPGH